MAALMPYPAVSSRPQPPAIHEHALAEGVQHLVAPNRGRAVSVAPFASVYSYSCSIVLDVAGRALKDLSCPLGGST